MLDHIGLAVSDYGRSKAFYTGALAPLGVAPTMEYPIGEGKFAGGFGTPEMPFFWINNARPADHGVHVAFSAPDRATVDAFYQAAIAAGGTDNGKPGLRPQYHPGYYGAFVLDPDGNNIEAVCHRPA